MPDSPTPRNTEDQGNAMGTEVTLRTSTASVHAISTPARPSVAARHDDSTRNWFRMSRRRAPSDLRMPISCVRSVTTASMMFMITMPPTSMNTDTMPTAMAAMADVSRSQRVTKGLLPPSPGDVPAHIPPGVQRLVARLGEIPLAVFTASWDLVTWSPLWAALLGEPVQPGPGRLNLLRSHFTGTALGDGERRIVSRSGDLGAFEASLLPPPR